ncbi:hypothetical protein I552_8760 [Mycobacterium xenopi 3993]|nr:hypothetical protein I552_8760 [Mycobacterium xenopi 3993]
MGDAHRPTPGQAKSVTMPAGTFRRRTFWWDRPDPSTPTLHHCVR